MEEIKKTQMARLDSLTGVRFFAALLVFGFHAMHNVDGLALFSSGMTGVSLFYILSGFMMSWSAREGDTAIQFYRRRFARIYPAFISAWLIALSLMLATSRRLGSGWDLLPPSLIQAWIPIEAAYFAGSAVFWSLSCEAFFYVMFPLLYKLMSPLTTKGILAVGLGAVGVSVSVTVGALGVSETPFSRWALVIFPPLRLMEFIVGMAIGAMFRRGFRLAIPVWVASLIAVGAVMLASIAPYSLSRYTITLAPFIILVAALASADLKEKWTLFRWRPLMHLGVWSYCFYLIHALVLTVAFIGAPAVGLRADWLILGLALGGSITTSWLMHVWIERPFEKRLRPTPRARIDADIVGAR